MTIARRDIVIDSIEGVYHCISRCVRRAFLCGDDPYTGQNFDHRKGWVQWRLKKLAGIFCIDVGGYAVMSNHIHLILRNCPDKRKSLSNDEVARRWRRLFPKSFQGNHKARELEIKRLVNDPDRLAVLRERLGSISWFMKCLNEPIARHANEEDGCKGHFWEGRFKSQALLDEAAVLACLAYVDLNPVRAGIANTPEESDFTGAHDHIEHHLAEAHIKILLGKKKKAKSKRRREAESAVIREEKKHLRADDWLCPLEDEAAFHRGGVHGLLPITPDCKPILTRLNINCERWVSTVCDFGRLFHNAAGHADVMMMAARRAGRHWFQGLGPGGIAFPDPPS